MKKEQEDTRVDPKATSSDSPTASTVSADPSSLTPANKLPFERRGIYAVDEHGIVFAKALYGEATYGLPLETARRNMAYFCHAANCYPELLAALKAIVARHEGYELGMGACVCSSHVMARAAIAKAEGRAT